MASGPAARQEKYARLFWVVLASYVPLEVVAIFGDRTARTIVGVFFLLTIPVVIFLRLESNSGSADGPERDG